MQYCLEAQWIRRGAGSISLHMAPVYVLLETYHPLSHAQFIERVTGEVKQIELHCKLDVIHELLGGPNGV